MSQPILAPSGDKGAALGHPSYIWTAGLERRLGLVRRYVSLEGKRILDIGCGIGTFTRRFGQFSDHVYGVDIDQERVAQGKATRAHLALAIAEKLPFRDGTFDVVLLHEVIEHVKDDALTLQEACRVVDRGGHIIIFCPNRLYPFETHGIFLGKRYIFGNIPLVNYLPDFLRNRLVPQARAYTKAQLRRLWLDLPLSPMVNTIIFPGFDHLLSRRRVLGGVLRAVFHRWENSPLRIFGLSHFVVLKKG